MSVTSRLVFDVTDAGSIAASANVGSWLRAGDDGTQIGHVSDAIKVSLTNASVAVTATNLDIRDLVFATDKVDVSGSSVSISGTVAVTQSTSPWVVSATDLDIRDLAAATDSVSAWTKDGSGTAINSTSNALNVYVTGSGALTINDAALANTAISANTTTVGTSLISAISSILSARKYAYFYNNGNKPMYLGTTGTTTADGFPMFPGMGYEFRAGASIDFKIISTAASQDLRHLQLS
jgi:hypothetical protein